MLAAELGKDEFTHAVLGVALAFSGGKGVEEVLEVGECHGKLEGRTDGCLKLGTELGEDMCWYISVHACIAARIDAIVRGLASYDALICGDRDARMVASSSR
jgi:hypothetical protein